MLTDAAIEALRRELLAEATEVARALEAPARDDLLGEVARAIGSTFGFDEGLAAAAALDDPAWRANALALLVKRAPDDAGAARALAALRASAALLARETGVVARPSLGDVVAVLARAGDVELAQALCARGHPGDAAPDELVGALIVEGRLAEAMEVARGVASTRYRDGLLETVADAHVAAGAREEALAAVEAMTDRFERERARLGVLGEMSGADHDGEAGVALGAMDNPVAALHAMLVAARRCQRHDDDAGARAFATVAARVAALAVEPALRDRALGFAMRMQVDFGDPVGAISTARLIREARLRDDALVEAFWALVPEDPDLPVDPHVVVSHAADDEERDAAALVIARSWLERRDLARAQEWARRVQAPRRRSIVMFGIADQALEQHGDVATALDALREVPHDQRDEMTMRNLAIDQLRIGDHAGAAATLAGIAGGGEWATWSLAGLVARYGQVAPLREWARAYLPPALRAHALLGASAYLDQPPPYDDPALRVFQPRERDE